MTRLGTIVMVALMIVSTSASQAQNMASEPTPTITVTHLRKDFAVGDLGGEMWKKGKEVSIRRYWSGDEAPSGRGFRTTLLWSDTALYVRFVAERDEPLVISEKPQLSKKTLGLWERDVCEIFIAPDKAERNKYFEFEIAPTSEWIDLALNVTSTGRETDWDYHSGMTSAAKIEKNSITMTIKIPWKGLGRTPRAGDVWLGNLFRCVGLGPTRGYLSWQPTKTPVPNFHVPEAFGELRFIGE